MVSLLAACLLLVATAGLLLAILGALSRRSTPRVLGARPLGLAPCPASPNCVASRGSAGSQRVEPLRFEGDAAEARRRLAAILGALPRTRIVAERPGYLRAEARSALFGFVDDVEFLFDPEERRIDVRSASRVGRSDFGANRARVLEIARRFAAGD